MWAFMRRQALYFSWGFAITLAIIVAWKVGVGDLVNYAMISAVVGLVVTVAIFFLERRFPDRSGDRFD